MTDPTPQREGPDAATRQRLGALLGAPVHDARVVTRGFTPARRWLISLEGGERLFVKLATVPFTAESLRNEARVYTTIAGPFLPHLVAWEDHPEHPVLVLKDLSEARWPPPWDSALVTAVHRALEAVHAVETDLPTFTELHGRVTDGWQQVARDPAPFAGLGMVDEDWLQRALPQLVAASSEVDEDAPGALTHSDIRSDNLCLTADGVRLVDWGWACRGNPDLDTAFWLPSLHDEGGPAPETTFADRPELAAVVSGFFAARAGLPSLPGAPGVRGIQRRQLRTALAWARRALKL